MGKWAKRKFGVDSFGDVGIIVAGTGFLKDEKQFIELFDEVVSQKDSVYHAYVIKKNNKTYPVAFNIYGGSAVVDAVTYMHDGGCRSIIFVGIAYGFYNGGVGSVFVPERAFHFDGLFDCGEYAREYSDPDEELMRCVEDILAKNDEQFEIGPHVSVPSVTMQPMHDNQHYQRIKPSTLDLELAPCFARCHDLKMRCAAVLVVGDNATHSHVSVKEHVYEKKQHILMHIAKQIDQLHLPKLEESDDFNIDRFLAKTIDIPDQKENIYDHAW